jgi:hypothetical protein
MWPVRICRPAYHPAVIRSDDLAEPLTCDMIITALNPTPGFDYFTCRTPTVTSGDFPSNATGYLTFWDPNRLEFPFQNDAVESEAPVSCTRCRFPGQDRFRWKTTSDRWCWIGCGSVPGRSSLTKKIPILFVPEPRRVDIKQSAASRLFPECWLRYVAMFGSCHRSLRTNRCFDLIASEIFSLKSLSPDLLCLLRHFSIESFKPIARNSYEYRTNDYHSGWNDHSWILDSKPGYYSLNSSWLIAFIVNTTFVNDCNLIWSMRQFDPVLSIPGMHVMFIPSRKYSFISYL